MDNFTKEESGYNKTQVNDFIDYVIKKTEENINTIRTQKDEITRLQSELERYQRLEYNLNYANINNERVNYELKENARKEAELIINEAKNNANKIVNDSLIKAEQLNLKEQTINENIKACKKKLRTNLLQQLDLVEDIEIL